MITQTALRSPRYLAAIKAATVQAIRTAHSRITPAAAVWVENRRGDANLYVQACRGKPVEYRDNNGRDLTDMVLGALREWHQMLRAQRAWKRNIGLPLRLEDFPSVQLHHQWVGRVPRVPRIERTPDFWRRAPLDEPLLRDLLRLEGRPCLPN